MRLARVEVAVVVAVAVLVMLALDSGTWVGGTATLHVCVGPAHMMRHHCCYRGPSSHFPKHWYAPPYAASLTLPSSMPFPL